MSSFINNVDMNTFNNPKPEDLHAVVIIINFCLGLQWVWSDIEYGDKLKRIGMIVL